MNGISEVALDIAYRAFDTFDTFQHQFPDEDQLAFTGVPEHLIDDVISFINEQSEDAQMEGHPGIGAQSDGGVLVIYMFSGEDNDYIEDEEAA